MDINSKAKEKVLQQLIDMMDERMVGDLKIKSPKFAKIDIQSDDPKVAENLKDKIIKDVAEDDNEDSSKEMSPEDLKEDKAEGEDPFNESDHNSLDNDEDMKRLLEMYHNLK